MAAAASFAVPKPAWQLSYAGANITARIETMVRSVKYTSKLSGAASEMEIELEDRDRRWQGPWLPVRGDRVTLMIGHSNELLRNCGDFQIDEVELNGPPDVVTMRCISAYITPAMRTHNTVGWENQTLSQIAATIAGKYGLTVVGAPSNVNVTWQRVTQRQETDLGFLKRLADEANYEFAVRGSQLIFYYRPTLESQPAVMTIQRTHETRFNFKTQTETHQVFQSAQVSWMDPVSKQLITGTAQASPAVPTGDTLKIRRRFENGQQAAAYAASELHRMNMRQVTGRLTCPGSSKFAGGNNIQTSGWGQFDLTYLIESAHHELSRDRGWSAELEMRSVS